MDTADRLAIIDVLHRYAHCYDEGDLDGLAALFTEDATFTIGGGAIGGMPSTMQGRAEIRESMGRRREATAAAQRRHLITNVIVDDIADDRAAAASYLLLGSTEDGALALPVTGRYTDELVRQADGTWRISRRELRLDGRIG